MIILLHQESQFIKITNQKYLFEQPWHCSFPKSNFQNLSIDVINRCAKINKQNTCTIKEVCCLANLPDTQILHQHTSWWLVWCQELPGKQKHSKMFKFGRTWGECCWAMGYSNYDHFDERLSSEIRQRVSTVQGCLPYLYQPKSRNFRTVHRDSGWQITNWKSNVK